MAIKLREVILVRRTIHLCLALGVAAAVTPAGLAEARENKVSCEVLLPAAAVPGDEGSYLTMLRLTVPPSHDGHRHVHAAAEYLAVISGTGSATIDGQGDLPLHPDDIVTIPPKVEHQLHNHSATEPLVFTATLVGHIANPLLTRYVGEPDKLSGCPHAHKHSH